MMWDLMRRCDEPLPESANAQISRRTAAKERAYRGIARRRKKYRIRLILLVEREGLEICFRFRTLSSPQTTGFGHSIWR
jgi:hypothetical protein